MPLSRPTDPEFPPDSRPAHYIGLVPHAHLLHALRDGKDLLINTFSAIPESKLLYRYVAGKWTVLEVLGHIIDVERIMAYRALCIARGEEQSLPGFDEDSYVATANFPGRSLGSLLDEYRLQREANLLMAEHLPESGLLRMGRANGTPFSARALLWLAAGHELHHLTILNERYLG
ncbi:MAG: DinB family protein [Bacteroidetes bacterium]|nr:DinB family protein [Fibrella sp.]